MSLSRLCGLRGRAGQEGEQARQLLAGQIDGAIRPGSIRSGRAAKAEIWASARCPYLPLGDALTHSHHNAFCNFHGPPSKIHALVTANRRGRSRQPC